VAFLYATRKVVEVIVIILFNEVLYFYSISCRQGMIRIGGEAVWW